MGFKGCRAIGEDSGNQGRCGAYGFMGLGPGFSIYSACREERRSCSFSRSQDARKSLKLRLNPEPSCGRRSKPETLNPKA